VHVTRKEVIDMESMCVCAWVDAGYPCVCPVAGKLLKSEYNTKVSVYLTATSFEDTMVATTGQNLGKVRSAQDNSAKK
jgi:hypothetical protein